MPGALDGLTVIDLSSTPPGAIATQLLADHGAYVLHVEPPGGSPLRSAAAYPMWARGSHSIELDVRDPAGLARCRDLIAGADVVVEAWRPGVADRLGLGYAELSEPNPGLVYASITGFGRLGPYAGLQGYEALVTAKLGVMFARSAMTQRSGPAFVSAPYCSYAAAHLALQGILASLYERTRSGRGQHVESSLAQGLASLAPYNWFLRVFTQRYPDAFTPAPAYSDNGVPTRGTFFNLIVAMTSDGGWLQFAQNQPRLFAAMLDELGLGWMLSDPTWSTAPNFETEAERSQFWDHMLTAIRSKSVEEWAAICARNRDVSGELFRSGTEVFDHPQLVHDGSVVTIDDPERGPVRQLGPQVRMAATPAHATRPAPRLGEHAPVPERHAIQPQASTAAQNEPPLTGVTVLDLGTFFAGPFGTALLADLGARVYKIEPVEGEPLRMMLAFPEAGGIKVMQGKESIAIDMGTPEGRHIVHELARRSDLALNSFRAGVGERLGVDAASLRAVNPDLVYLDARGYGVDGPHAGSPAFAPSIGAASGQAMRNAGRAVPHDPSMTLDEVRRHSVRLAVASNQESAQADGVAALGAATALLLGLLARERLGLSQSMVTTMLLSGAYAVSDDLVEYSGRPELPRADADLYGLHARYRLYECADEGWVFLAVPADRDWQRLLAALAPHDGTEQLEDSRFAAIARAPEVDAELASILVEIFARASADEWEAELMAAGVGCVAVSLEPVEAVLMSDAVGGASGFVTEVDHPTFGPMPRLAPLVRLGRTPGVARPAPYLGQHTRAVLGELGLDHDAVDDLAARGLITT